MNIHFNLIPGGDLEMTDGLPPSYNGKLLAQARYYSSQTATGMMVIQESLGPEFSIRYQFIQFLKKVIVQGNCYKQGLYVRIMMSGRLSLRLKDLGKIRLKQGQFTAVYADAGECLSYYDRNRIYEIVDLYFSSNLLAPLVELYPRLQELVRITGSTPIQLNVSGTMLNQELLDLVNSLFDSSFTSSTAVLHTEDTIREIAELIIIQAFGPPPRPLNFSEQEIDTLRSIRSFIEENYRKHFTIRQLASQAGMNEFKLKLGFRHIFRMSIFDCLLWVRMKKAHQLVLHTNEPIKKISLDVGYSRLPSFVTAFRKYYGQSPGRLRQSAKTK